MGYKSIFTVVTAAAQAGPVVTAAAGICLAEDGHLDALALAVDRTQIGYSYIGTSAVVLQVEIERAEAEARALETATIAAMQAQSPALRWSVEAAVAQMGGLTDLVASRARFADLVVLPRPYGPGQGPEAEAVVEAALFEGQSAVLVLPGDHPTVAMPRRIVVAWNQSAEARIAVRKALPLLKAADLVNIAVVDPSSHGPERSDPGGMLCQMLVRHGVRAEVSVLARALPRVSDVLARHLRDMNADLLVMGAYGHSRLRESVLGGATRHMLELAEVPVFMAH